MKKVLITGGNKGIGLEVTKKFVHNGYMVFVAARNKDGFDDSHENIQFIEMDLLKENATEQVFNKTGPVDVLINNAGIMQTFRFGDYSDADRDRLMNLNLYVPVKLSEKYYPGMKERGGGRIVNLCSIVAHTGHPDIWYGASKAGLLNITKSLAKQIEADNIIINAVAPGPVHTDMIEIIPQARRDVLIKNTIGEKFIQPSEVAETVFWLGTNSPSTINGTCIDINNGIYLR